MLFLIMLIVINIFEWWFHFLLLQGKKGVITEIKALENFSERK